MPKSGNSFSTVVVDTGAELFRPAASFLEPDFVPRRIDEFESSRAEVCAAPEEGAVVTAPLRCPAALLVRLLSTTEEEDAAALCVSPGLGRVEVEPGDMPWICKFGSSGRDLRAASVFRRCSALPSASASVSEAVPSAADPKRCAFFGGIAAVCRAETDPLVVVVVVLVPPVAASGDNGDAGDKGGGAAWPLSCVADTERAVALGAALAALGETSLHRAVVVAEVPEEGDGAL